MSEPLVLAERKQYGDLGHVAWITVNKPRKANCLDHETLLAFADAVNAESQSPDLRAMVITGAGERAFMAGADLNVIAGQDADGAKLFLTRVHCMCQSVRECPVPVIARINGACFGAALELVAACDLHIASANAAFGMPEVNVGLPSVVEACLLPQLIGWGKTKHLVYTAETIDAEKALAWGLLAAARLSGKRLFLGAYPITPASDILHELAKHKNFDVLTFQDMMLMGEPGADLNIDGWLTIYDLLAFQNAFMTGCP